MNKKLISLILGIMCLLLSMGISIQIRTINNFSNKAITKTATENELRDSVLREKEKYDNTYYRIERLEKELEKLRENATQNSADSEELKNKLKEYDDLLGYTELKGKGIKITLTDGNPDALNHRKLTDYIVHDGDLVHVVNDLKQAGADAIAINDQRIVNTTAISCVGNVVTINGEKVGVPFTIQAIGSPEMLYRAMTMLGGYLSIVETDGVKVEIEKSNDITVPKFDGVYNYSYMKTVE